MRKLEERLQLVANTKEVQKLVEIVYKRYPAFDNLPARERFVLVASVLVSDIKIREPEGPNEGPWQRIMGKYVSLDDGYAWCAIFVYFCAVASGLMLPGLSPRKAPSVREIYLWAKRNNMLTDKPTRGDLVLMLNSNGTGHIGIFLSRGFMGTTYTTLEGNTSSGESGSQRDGDGAYRRRRAKSFWDYAIKVV